jgi:hypothetical protein
MGVSFYGIMVVREDLVKHLPPPKPTAEPTEAETPPPRPKRRRKSRAKKKPPRRDPPIYGEIKQKAREVYPQGYRDIPTKVLFKNVNEAFGKDAPSRYRIERALGRRKRRRK